MGAALEFRESGCLGPRGVFLVGVGEAALRLWKVDKVVREGPLSGCVYVYMYEMGELELIDG